VGDDLQGKLAILTDARHLIQPKSPEWQSAKNEGASVKSKVLFTLFSLFADQVNGFELPETPLGDLNGR
jgi:hypothetical protein